MEKEQKHNNKIPTMKLSRTLPDGTTKSIELPAPTSIKTSMVLITESGELKTDESVSSLMYEMFNRPEIGIEHYSEYGNPKDKALIKAIDRGDIILANSENYYYKHPEADRFYIKLNPAEKELTEWEKDLVKSGSYYIKNILKLSERKKREYETWQKIEMEDIYRKRKQEIDYSYDVFLSYSEKDHSIATMVHEKLTNENCRVFMAPKSLNPGEDFAERIRNSLLGSSELWVVVSPNSLTSEWVITEWGAAWVLKKTIIPILHRCDIPQLPERLRRVQSIDVARIDELINSKFSTKIKK